MTDSLKLAEMQRTSIEFERQRHLANWFIKSSPHMANSQSSHYPNAGGGCCGLNGSNNIRNGYSNAQILNKGTKTGTITKANPLFLLPSSSAVPSGGGGGGQPPPPLPPHQLGGNLILSRSQLNLPIQDDHKTRLRRFNSHDTSTNMFSVAEFENARLARRNEIELKQRQQQRKINSLSSGGDCSTGDSKESKHSVDSQPVPLIADIFLERYSLPRIVKVSIKPLFNNETLQSSSSNGSSSSNSSPFSFIKSNNYNLTATTSQNGELFLLYRHLQQRKIYHGYSTKSGVGNRKKGIRIPQEFPGYFSFVNEKGLATATMYTTLIQLVRERVYKFISTDDLSAFAESQSMTDTFQTRTQYIKSTARAGQVFRLLAVFEDGKQDNSSSSNKNNSSGREKEKGRYAQLLSDSRQILYVSLTAKGKFYEIESSIPQILQKSGMISSDIKRKVNPDCIHRITNIINEDRGFPINLKFISGQLNIYSNAIPEYITISKMSTENIVIACPIEDIEIQPQLHLRKLNVTSQMVFTKCYENEPCTLSNQNIQNILKFCQFNYDHFLKMIEIEILNTSEHSSSKGRPESLKILKPLNLPKLLRREKSATSHERQNSIIFLSKNDLDNLESLEDNSGNQRNTSQISNTIKVFRSTKKKWFKRSEIERYYDMSKLLQERFGDALTATSNDVNERSTSEIGCTDKKSESQQIQKSFSLQEIDFIEKPDLLPTKFVDQNLSTCSEKNLITYEDENNKKVGQSIISISSTACNNSNKNENKQSELLQSQQQSFISDKMYSEFHVKTRQHSKSSSGLHQLFYFAMPQRKNDYKKNNRKFLDKQQQQYHTEMLKNLEYRSYSDLPSTKTDYLNNIAIIPSNSTVTAYKTTTIIDDLPYSSVRDSLLTSNLSFDDSNCNFISSVAAYKTIERIITTSKTDLTIADNTKENIYAEICDDYYVENRHDGTTTITTAATTATNTSIIDVENCSNRSILHIKWNQIQS